MRPRNICGAYAKEYRGLSEKRTIASDLNLHSFREWKIRLAIEGLSCSRPLRRAGGTTMEMHQVRYVLALRDNANFTRAAEACGVSQPSLTRAIRRLETELGGPLFHRLRNNIRPTELGEMMLPHLEEIAAGVERVRGESERLMQRARKTLRLGVMCTIAPDPLLLLVTRMLAKHPEIDLKITDFEAAQLETLLLENKVDIALLSPKHGKHENLHYHFLFKEQMLAILHPEHSLAGRDELHAKDLIAGSYVGNYHLDVARRYG